MKTLGAFISLVPGLILFLALGIAPVRAADALAYPQQDLRIPMPEAGAKGLQVRMVYPPTSGKHPLVLLSHGSPRNAASRPLMSPGQMVPQALEFARRGWAVAIVMRRGYGGSGGAWAEAYGPCNRAQYQAAGEAAREDLRAVVDYLSKQPQVDTSRILAVGVSAGGFATVALSAEPPPGLLAGISFAGGRGSTAADTVCDERALVNAFRAFGANAKVPMLWVYSENDHFFSPDLAQKFLAAYEAGGQKVDFVMAPAFGDDGHALFSYAGVPVWTRLVEPFLAKQKLTWVNAPFPLPPPPDLPAPRALSAEGRAAWKKYLQAPSHKAFAMTPNGRYGWRSGRSSADEAEEGALEVCAEDDCELVASGDERVSR